MIIKQGYVFIASFGNPLIEHLFGPAKEEKERKWDNLQSNEITPFQTLDEAREVMQNYEAVMKKVIPDLKTNPAYLQLRIAEDEKEARKAFSKSKDLVVIAYDHTTGGVGDTLIGRRVDGKPGQYPLYGARMTQNGFATIQNFNNAEYIASEAQRQAGFGIKLARFKLKRIQ